MNTVIQPKSVKKPSYFSAFAKIENIKTAQFHYDNPGELLTTGSISLDYALGGGIPRGRISLFWGEAGTGKTWQALRMMSAELSKFPEKTALWIDTEGSFDAQRALDLGVDLDRVQVLSGNTAEEIITPLAKVKKLMLEGKDCCFIGLDSVKALVPSSVESALENGNISGATNAYGGIAKTVNPLVSLFKELSEKLDIPIVMINHASDEMDAMKAMKSKVKMGGGHYLRHMASVVMQFIKSDSSKTNLIDESEKTMNDKSVIVGYRTRVKVGKTRRTVEGKEGEFYVNFANGIIVNKEEEAIDLGMNLGLITTTGTKHHFGEMTSNNYGVHKSGYVGFLKENPSVLADIEKAILARCTKKTAFQLKLDEQEELKEKELAEQELEEFGSDTVEVLAEKLVSKKKTK
jgi:recombination protein RecA